MKDVNKQDLFDIYYQLVECIGFENARKVYEVLGGQQITFPKRFYKPEYVVKIVKEHYDGVNLKELAKEFDYTERYLRQLIKEILE